MLLPLHMNLGLASVRSAGSPKSYVEIDGELIRVSGYDEAKRLLSEVHKEEKAQEKDRKKLKLAVKKITVDTRAMPKSVEVIEKRMDDRQERITALYAKIMESLLEQDEDETLTILLQ